MPSRLTSEGRSNLRCCGLCANRQYSTHVDQTAELRWLRRQRPIARQAEPADRVVVESQRNAEPKPYAMTTRFLPELGARIESIAPYQWLIRAATVGHRGIPFDEPPRRIGLLPSKWATADDVLHALSVRKNQFNAEDMAIESKHADPVADLLIEAGLGRRVNEIREVKHQFDGIAHQFIASKRCGIVALTRDPERGVSLEHL
jgi:hypothetical protein